jgi:signal transduction histidine kinase
MAPDPVNQSADGKDLFLYDGRYARAFRMVALAVIAGTSFIGRPHPSWSGHGLVILISLVVAVSTQLVAVIAPTRRGALVRTVIGGLAGGVLVGFDPTVGTAILLVFIGVDAGANLELAPGLVVVALVVVTTAIAVLASGAATAVISQGGVALLGFMAAAGRKQFVLRAEEAELRLADAERAREEHARAAGLAERANAAREIHDILAHSLGALVLQLDALDAVLSSDTLDRRRATELLTRARALAVDGLSEARQAVGTLRADPPPLVEALRQLVDVSGAASLVVAGTPRPLSPELSVALRRTAQEGLANAVKHAAGAPSTVELSFNADEIILTVTDAGCHDGALPGPLADTGGGYGLEGLRERAELLGGTLVAGPVGAGWQVRLSVPENHGRSGQGE